MMLRGSDHARYALKNKQTRGETSVLTLFDLIDFRVSFLKYSMGRGVVHACHAGGVVHFLEGWKHHEVGAIDVDQIDVVWEAALRHGLKPL